jgi:hypothetical protein
MSDLDVQLRSYLDTTAPPVEFDEIVTERFRDASVRPAPLDRSGPRAVHAHRPGWVRAAMAAVATIAVVGVIAVIVEQRQTQPVGTETPATITTAGVGPVAGGELLLHADDLAFRVTIPATGWEQPTDFALTKSTHGPQGAEAIIYWGQFPLAETMTMCSDELWGVPIGLDVGPMSRMTEAIADMPGLDVVEGPSVSDVGGYPAYRVTVSIEDDRGCDPGYFYGWQPTRGGAFWDAASTGDTIRVWIVDRGERLRDGGSPPRRDLLFIASMTTSDAGTAVDREISQIVESVLFEGYGEVTEDSRITGTMLGESGQLNEGEYAMSAGDIPFALTMPRGHWETYGGFLISTSTQGSQGAEAAIYWTEVPPLSNHTGEGITACHFSTFPFSGGRSTQAVPGLQPLIDVEETTVGGRSARHMAFKVRERQGCDPGYFFGWKPQSGGMMWHSTDVGATINVWFVDLDDNELFIASVTSQDAAPGVFGEIDAIVDSIRFED